MRAARIFLPLLAALMAAATSVQAQQSPYSVDPATGRLVPAVQQSSATQSPQTRKARKSYASRAQTSRQDTGNRGLFNWSHRGPARQSSAPRSAQHQPYARQAYSQPAHSRDSKEGYVQEYYGPHGYVMQYRPPRPAVAAAPPATAAYAAAPARQAYAAAPSRYAYAPATDRPYTLGSGDKLRVVVFGQQGITGSYMVDASGNVSLPLIGSVPAQGETTGQLARSIVARLKQGYVRDPHVTVEVETYRPFFILGEVTNPGQYPYVPNMTAETAVAIAGGFSPRADKHGIQITRSANGQHYKGDVPLSYPLHPGDTVMVKERWF